jgi:hypothetical protein
MGIVLAVLIRARALFEILSSAAANKPGRMSLLAPLESPRPAMIEQLS